MRLVQIAHPHHGRRTAIVDGTSLHLLASHHTTYDLANAAIDRGQLLHEAADADRGSETLPYDEIYEDRSAWKLLIPFDHPEDPAHCLVSGTGLTHKASAENRARMHLDKMHQTAPHQAESTVLTDSMRMYQWGLDGGSPAPGEIGVQPEWFYKGDGSILRAHNQPLTVPAFAEDGGEEPEVAGAYLIGPDGTPYRAGLVTGNEFSDHKMERRNYLYLAPSKLRQCAIGPELITGSSFQTVEGVVAIERNGDMVWSAIIYTGEKNMSHTVANLEHHHFKYPQHRRPGDVHVHFFGADAFSFGAGIELRDGDLMLVSWPDLGRALRNPIHIAREQLTAAQIAVL
jgi:hypothetical protein